MKKLRTGTSKGIMRLSMKIRFLILSAALFLGAAAIAAETAPKTPPAALRADFVMTRSVSALKTDLKSGGRLILGGPGKLRWETLSPAKSLLIINGKQGWIHYPDLQMTKAFDLSMDPVMKVMSEHLSVLTSGRFEDAEAMYDVSPAKDGRRILIPKSTEIKKLFKEMQVLSNTDGTVREVVLISANGDKTTIDFKNIEPNPKLTPDLFAPPKTR